MSIAVLPSFQRRGLAKMLMTRLIEESLSEGGEYVVLEVRKSNEAAKNLYKTLGFHTIGTRRRYYQNGEDAEVMLLQLS